jgi:alpha-galactosidase
MKILNQFACGDMTAQYWRDVEGHVGLTIFPTVLEANIPPHRKDLNHETAVRGLAKTFDSVFHAECMDSLVQLKLRGDVDSSGFSAGTSMRNSESCRKLILVNQELEQAQGKTVIRTHLEHSSGLQVEHVLSHPYTGARYFEIHNVLKNTSSEKITIDMLSSFSLFKVSPFQKDDGPDAYIAHRYQSFWSAEGRHQAQSFESLGLERSWSGHAAKSLRYGQVGSMPVKEYFPFVAVEDQKANVFWGARLSIPGSWQIELYRQADGVSMSGGLADREFGHWTKTIHPTEIFESPKATLTVCEGSLAHMEDRLLDAQESPESEWPETERDLPIIFNEWCTSWGLPSEENMMKLAHALDGSEVKYLVMDDGWFNEHRGCQQGIGDWNIAQSIYPSGFKQMCRKIRDKGFEPGIWFEFESTTEGSCLFEQKEHLLHADGLVLQKGARRFLDFRDPWVIEYLHTKVTDLLIDNDLRYIKIDYNDSIGMGVDGPDSFGESLREHLEAVQEFMKDMKRRIPGLVIEICSSGGHRLEPSFMEIGAMGGFSDSHEGLDIPIIAYNTAQHILTRKNQVWAVLRKEDDEKRLHYSLAATFSGRMCLSGDLYDLDGDQMAIVNEAQSLYRRCVPIIKNGRNDRTIKGVTAFMRPQGLQSVVRYHRDQSSAMLVFHSFFNPPKVHEIELEGQGWEIEDRFATSHVQIECTKKETQDVLKISNHQDLEGLVVLLRKR